MMQPKGTSWLPRRTPACLLIPRPTNLPPPLPPPQPSRPRPSGQQRPATGRGRVSGAALRARVGAHAPVIQGPRV
jgi:hypothetical protein